MTNPNVKLATLGDQILRSLDKLPGNDPKTQAVRASVRALMSALSEPERNAQTDRPQGPVPKIVEQGTFAPLPDEHVSDFARPPFNAPGYESESAALRPGSVPPNVPKTYAGRRALRRAAGLTLKEVATKAKVTLPTARMYEANRMAVTKPDKRADLDRVYEAFHLAIPK